MSNRNVLFIMVDQQRRDFLGYAGASFVDTPNIDRLAARGRVFNRCYTTSPVCAPARISLATGLLPTRVGSVNNNSFLPRGSTTYYERLRDYGWYTGLVGKVDLAKPDPYNGRDGDRPVMYSYGFTHPVEAEGKMHAGRCADGPIGPYTRFLDELGLREAFAADYDKRRSQGWSAAAWDSVLPADAFEDTWIGQRACQWLRDIPKDFPFHLLVSFVGPHDPFDPPKEFADRYRDVEMPPAIESDPESRARWVQSRQHPHLHDRIPEFRRQYCAAIIAIDVQVGQLLDTLDDLGLSDDTLIVFTSDHGEQVGDHDLYTKHTHYESSWGVPLILAGPDIEAGSSEELVQLYDCNPTVCDWCGLPPQEGIDARSILPHLKDPTEPIRDHVVMAESHVRAISNRRWKLATAMGDRSELYDLEADPEETVNLAGTGLPEEQQLLRQMEREFVTDGAWLRG
jgi:choline-sulfatase